MVHVPLALAPSAALHTWHELLHAALQQNPSLASPVAHALATVDDWPVFRPHALAPLHVIVAPHSPCGSLPTSTLLQVPFVPPVSDAAQAMHPPHDAVEQQKPSTQPPVAHSWQLAPRQSAPAAVLHVAPVALRGWHVPFAAQ